MSSDEDLTNSSLGPQLCGPRRAVPRVLIASGREVPPPKPPSSPLDRKCGSHSPGRRGRAYALSGSNPTLKLRPMVWAQGSGWVTGTHRLRDMKAHQWSGIQGKVLQRRWDQTGVCAGGRAGLHSSRETVGKVKDGGAVVRGGRGCGWRLEPKVGSAWNKHSVRWRTLILESAPLHTREDVAWRQARSREPRGGVRARGSGEGGGRVSLCWPRVTIR